MQPSEVKRSSIAENTEKLIKRDLYPVNRPGIVGGSIS